jgi:tetratricopeptide (TPR) repeat protein
MTVTCLSKTTFFSLSFLLSVLYLSAAAMDTQQFALANRLLHENKFEAAAKIYHTILNDDPKNALVWEAYGTALDGQNESKGAVAAYTQAINLGVKKWDVYHARGMSYSHLGNFENAVADFNVSIKAGVANADARASVYCDRADAELLLKRFCDAANDYTMYITTMSLVDWARYTHRARAYAGCGKLPEAIRDMTMFVKAPNIKPKQREGGYTYRAELYSRSKQYDKAISDLSSAFAISPDRAVILRERAKLYDLVGKKDLADKDRAKSKQIDDKLYGDP